jgi:Asp-tRNA(Asn)/Glu-tRNA(Gln) amidotransferase A subunit family amidase
MLAEMAPVYAKYDVLLAPTSSGPAPRLDTWCTIRFWQHASLMTPFNVTGGPALAQCMGFTTEGLPLSLQIVGRPFDEATVLRAAYAYEKATPWRSGDLCSILLAASPPRCRRRLRRNRSVTPPGATWSWRHVTAPGCR